MPNLSMELEVLVKVLISMVLAGGLGWEREAKGKSAGIRTHMLVGLGSTLFVVLGELFVLHFSDRGEQLRFDPVRIIEAIVTGIAFLGAGTVFVAQGENKVKGLTTAASILVTSAVGMIVGLGYFALAVMVTVLIFIVLFVLSLLKDRLT